MESGSLRLRNAVAEGLATLQPPVDRAEVYRDFVAYRGTIEDLHSVEVLFGLAHELNWSTAAVQLLLTGCEPGLTAAAIASRMRLHDQAARERYEELHGEPPATRLQLEAHAAEEKAQRREQSKQYYLRNQQELQERQAAEQTKRDEDFRRWQEKLRRLEAREHEHHTQRSRQGGGNLPGTGQKMEWPRREVDRPPREVDRRRPYWLREPTRMCGRCGAIDGCACGD